MTLNEIAAEVNKLVIENITNKKDTIILVSPRYKNAFFKKLYDSLAHLEPILIIDVGIGLTLKDGHVSVYNAGYTTAINHVPNIILVISEAELAKQPSNYLTELQLAATEKFNAFIYEG